MSMKAETRRADHFGEGQRSGRIDSHENRQGGRHAYYNRSERRRTQQQCRDYWRRMYGTRAERESRGGVSWVGGFNG